MILMFTVSAEPTVSPGSDKPRVVFMELHARNVDRDTALTIDESLAIAFSRYDVFDVVTAADLQATLELESAALPLFPGALNFARGGLLSGGAKRTRANMESEFAVEGVDDTLLGLMFDAETSGGLLIAVAEVDVAEAQRRLTEAGAACASVVGGFAAREEVAIRVS